MKSGANWVSIPAVSPSVVTTTNTQRCLPGMGSDNTTLCSSCSSSPRMSTRVDSQPSMKRKREDDDEYQRMVKRWKVEQKRGKKRHRLEEDIELQPVAKKQKLVQEGDHRGKKRTRIEDDTELHPVAKKQKLVQEGDYRGKKRTRIEDDWDWQPVSKKRKSVYEKEPISRGKKRTCVEEDGDWQLDAKKRRCDSEDKEWQLVAKKQNRVSEEDDTPSVGAAFAGIGFDNSCFHLIWKNVNIRLNQENLSQQNGTYGLQAAIFQTLNYQTDYRKSRAVLSGEI